MFNYSEEAVEYKITYCTILRNVEPALALYLLLFLQWIKNKENKKRKELEDIDIAHLHLFGTWDTCLQFEEFTRGCIKKYKVVCHLQD